MPLEQLALARQRAARACRALPRSRLAVRRFRRRRSSCPSTSRGRPFFIGSLLSRSYCGFQHFIARCLVGEASRRKAAIHGDIVDENAEQLAARRAKDGHPEAARSPRGPPSPRARSPTRGSRDDMILRMSNRMKRHALSRAASIASVTASVFRGPLAAPSTSMRSTPSCTSIRIWGLDWEVSGFHDAIVASPGRLANEIESILLEARAGIEPTYTALQAAA